MMASGEAKYTFQHLSGKKFTSVCGKDAEEYLLKWSMKGQLFAQVYSFDQQFQAYQAQDLATAFFQSPHVVSTLPVPSTSSPGKTSCLGVAAETVSIEAVPCSVLSMTFFDRLYNNKIVKESGAISKCFDEQFENFWISDELQKCLLLEDSDYYDLFSDSEREELLFRLFRHLCLGGEVCQYEDNIQPYLDITKDLYKEVLSVQKDPSTKELLITSHAYKVTSHDSSGPYFPSDRDHLQDFAYFIVDPLKRHVTVIYHRYGASIFEGK